MDTMVDYKNWFDNIDFDLDDRFDEVYSLYHAIKDMDSSYGVAVERKDGKLIVRYPAESQVALSISEDEKEGLVNYLDSLYELTIDGEHALRQAMSHND